MSTDAEWEKWGQKDPYFGVITHDKFRNRNLSEDVRREFFDSGREHIQRVIELCRKHIDAAFEVRRAVDFGCGTGRLVIPLAEISEKVVGIDISPSMLSEAGRNSESFGLANVELITSDDELSKLSGSYNFIHSYIVFQHMPVQRGMRVITRLLDHLEDGGIMAVQLTYSKNRFAASGGYPSSEFGWRFMRWGYTRLRKLKNLVFPSKDPEMQMNPYQLNRLFYLLQSRGIREFHSEFTDHGGELGVFLYFQKKAGPESGE
jgi:SAM-dependent methyltransferase